MHTLSSTTLEAIKPTDKAQDITIAKLDTDRGCLILRVHPDGKKLFYYRYFVLGSKRYVLLGNFSARGRSSWDGRCEGLLTLAAAKEGAKVLADIVAKHGDIDTYELKQRKLVDMETSRGYLGQSLEVSVQSLKDPEHVRVRNVENALDSRIVKVHPAKADGSMPITKQEIVNMMDSTSWAKDFSGQQILLLCDYLTVCHAQANEPIYNEGDVGNSMSILIKGTAKVYKANKALTELKADRTFGEMLLFDNERRSANIVAVDPCTFLSMDKTSFDRLSKDHSALALKVTVKIVRLLNQNIRRLSGQLYGFLEH